MDLSFLDVTWQVGTGLTTGVGIHFSTLLTYGLVVLWVLYFCRKNKFKVDVTVIWLAGVMLLNVHAFEWTWALLSRWFSSYHWFFIMFDQTECIALIVALILIYVVKRGKKISLNWSKWTIAFMVCMIASWLTWIIAPFPFEIIDRTYFPQTVYNIFEGTVLHIPNDYIRVVNIITKAFTAIFITNILLGGIKKCEIKY